VGTLIGELLLFQRIGRVGHLVGDGRGFPAVSANGSSKAARGFLNSVRPIGRVGRCRNGPRQTGISASPFRCRVRLAPRARIRMVCRPRVRPAEATQLPGITAFERDASKSGRVASCSRRRCAQTTAAWAGNRRSGKNSGSGGGRRIVKDMERGDESQGGTPWRTRLPARRLPFPVWPRAGNLSHDSKSN
jgi:hypothetical protein